MKSVEEINRALEQIGEPPLGSQDLVQSQFVESDGRVDDVAGDAEKKIQLVDPPGYVRSHMLFMNGREVLVDMRLEDLVEAVRAFMARPKSRRWWMFWRPVVLLEDFFVIPHIELVGGDQQGNGGVVVAPPAYFSRRALELMMSMGVTYARRVPGEEKAGGKGKVAVVRGAEAKSVIVQLNRHQRREMQRNGR